MADTLSPAFQQALKSGTATYTGSGGVTQTVQSPQPAQPVTQPVSQPTVQPATQPSVQPTVQPTAQPAAQPTATTDINSLVGTRPSTVDPSVTEYFNTQTGQGFANPQELANFINSQGGQTTEQSVFADIKKGFNTAMASGKQPPQDAGQASSLINAMTPKSPVLNIEQQLAQDPDYQQLLADRAEYTSIVNQSKSLVDTYNQMVKDANLPALNAELVNAKNIIEGTEDDIRNEVKASGGFATESQVMALSSARNKQLIKNYNRLLDEKSMAMESINNMVNLSAQDRQFAMQAIGQKLQIDQQLLEYRDRFVQNAREGYQNIINAVGYQGLYSMLENDPESMALAEQTLGLGAGQLEGISRFIQNANNLNRFADYNITSPYVIDSDGRTVVNTKTGEAYSSEQDFLTRTGMSLGQATQQGLLKPIGQTREQMQQDFENMIQLKGLEFEQQRIGLQRAGLGLEQQRINLSIAQAQMDANNAQMKQIQDIIAANPNEWGKAADQIEAMLGQKIETGSGIDRMLQAAYSTPPKDQVLQLSQAQNNIFSVDSLLTSAGLNSAVGPNYLARFSVKNQLTGEKANFIAGVEQLRSQLNLDTLIQAKAQGATFGALSDQELQVLASAATKLGTWAIVKDGKVTGYNASEKDFRAELDKINNFAKLDFVLKGGDPNSVGLFKLDGVWATTNSDGSIIKFDELRGL